MVLRKMDICYKDYIVERTKFFTLVLGNQFPHHISNIAEIEKQVLAPLMTNKMFGFPKWIFIYVCILEYEILIAVLNNVAKLMVPILDG